MTESDSKLVSEAFVKAQAEMPIVKFDSANPFFKSKYASLAAIIDATRPVLGKHGLAMCQIVMIKDGFVHVNTTIRHTSGQTLDCGSMSLGIGDTGKSEVQAAGSLITYLRRYAWQTALGISADEDDDGNNAPAKTTKPAAKPAPSNPIRATPAFRLQALNRLKAAPGQPNRELVTAYLQHREWLELQGDPDSWCLDYVPTNPEQMSNLSAAIQQWDIDRHKSDDLPM